MFWVKLGGMLLFSYLLGGIPFGLLVSWFKNLELRTLGSGNIGATNVYRALGLRWAILVFVLDAFKGAGSVLLAQYFLGKGWYAGLCGLFSVFGHIFSPYLRFRGGKGVACGFGVMLVLAPWASLLSLLVWALLVAWRKLVSLASLLASIILLILLWLFSLPLWVVGVGMGICLLVFWAHRANLARLLSGKELKIQRLNEPKDKDSE